MPDTQPTWSVSIVRCFDGGYTDEVARDDAYVLTFKGGTARNAAIRFAADHHLPVASRNLWIKHDSPHAAIVHIRDHKHSYVVHAQKVSTDLPEGS